MPKWKPTMHVDARIIEEALWATERDTLQMVLDMLDVASLDVIVQVLNKRIDELNERLKDV